MPVILEPPARPATRLADILGALDRHSVGNGVVGALFATTGPLAVLLAAARQGGLDAAAITAFVIAGYGLGGIVSILCSTLWRQSLGMAWTIPGVVLVGAALDHLTPAEVIGAYLGSGVLMLVLGLSGWVGRIMRALPMPIVMAMVAGVFLSFGLNVIAAFGQSWPIATAMVIAYGALAALRTAIPPVLGALAAGIAAVLATGGMPGGALDGPLIAAPTLYAPAFSWAAMVELVLPLTITVVGVHNAQGIAVLRANGMVPPVNSLTALCGAGTLLQGLLGAAPLCVTGPVNAVLNSSGRVEGRFAGGIVFGVLMLLFGLFGPLMTRLALGVPAAFIGALSGLATLRVLEQAFVVAFSGRFTLGAVVAFLVTVANVSPLHIGAPFWGLVLGFVTSWLVERPDFATLRGAPGAAE